MTSPTGPPRPAPRDGTAHLPVAFVAAVVVASALPALLGLLGVNLGARTPTIAELVMLPDEAALHRALRGAFLHTLLEAAAVGVALMTVALAWIHARISVSVAPPLLALALLVAGVMDLFHIATADYLVGGVEDGPQLIPFTWALSRILTGLALVAVGAALAARRRWEEGAGRRLLVSLSVAFTVASLGSVVYALSGGAIPGTLLPDNPVHRPLDLAALVLFATAGVLLAGVGRREPSLFVRTLGLSMVPAVAVQLHMAFGSSVLYDHDFNAGHILKVVSYAVPFFGLGLDYLRARSGEVSATALRVEAEVRERAAEERARDLAVLTRELERRNRDLDEFAHVASHDLRAPLRGIRNLALWIEEDLEERIDPDTARQMGLLRDRVERMDGLVEGLLRFSRVGRTQEEEEDVALAALAEEVVDLLAPPPGLEIHIAPDLPTLRGERLQLQQVLQNLLGNAMKHARGRVALGARRCDDGSWEMHVTDDGQGIPEAFHERIWVIFQQVGGDATEGGDGSGIGLAIVKKVVERNGGRAWVESVEGEGATFRFTWPKGAGTG